MEWNADMNIERRIPSSEGGKFKNICKTRGVKAKWSEAKEANSLIVMLKMKTVNKDMTQMGNWNYARIM